MNFWTVSLSVIMTCMLRQMALLPFRQGVWLQSGLAPYFNQVFISEQLQTQKPDALFYEKIGQEIAGFDKEKALMIGDSPNS